MVGTGRANREITATVPGIGRVVANVEQIYRGDGSVELEVLLGAVRVDPKPLSTVTEETQLRAIANALNLHY